MRRNAARREKAGYILAGIVFVLIAIAFLIFMIRGTGSGSKSNKEENTEATAAPEQTVTVTATPLPDGVTIGGKTVSKSTDTFDLSGVTLSDADRSGIASLYNLQTLSLTGCGITDVSFLSGLTGLRTLYLSGNSITDVSPLASLSGLSTLYLDNNPVTNLTPLINLTSLTTLSLQGVTMADYVLEDIRTSMPWCSIFNDSTVSEVRPISLGGAAFNADVTDLDLSWRGISDISKLSYCTQLQNLNLAGDPIEDLTTLALLPSLRSLNLSGVGLDDDDIPLLAGLSHLNYLDIRDNNFTAEGLDRLRNALTGCSVDCDSLYYTVTIGTATLTSDMTSVDVSYCAVESIEGMDKFTDLHVFRAVGNAITDISPLAGLYQLEEVDLSNNALSNLAPFAEHANLRVLRLANTKVQDLYPLHTCVSLQTLDLSGDTELATLYGIEGLYNLQELHVNGCPNLSQEEVQRIHETLPNCNIISDYELTTPGDPG